MQTPAFEVAMFPSNLHRQEQDRRGDVRSSMQGIVAALRDMADPLAFLSPAEALPQATEIRDAETFKILEVAYDAELLASGPAKIAFKDTAIDLIDDALSAAGAGVWLKIDEVSSQIRISFEVVDFERAACVVRAAVEGTPFAAIRAMNRVVTCDAR